MNNAIIPARKHPAALAAMVIAGIAMTALALVTIAYLLGYLPARGGSTPASMAIPGQQVVGTVQQGGVDLLPGETLIAPADAPVVAPPPAARPAEPSKPTTPQYAKPAPLEPAKPAPAKKTPPANSVQPAAPPPSTSYAEILPQRAAPSRPTYREAPAVPPPPRDYCVNCGTIASIGTAATGEWEVRVRFEDGTTEAMRYTDRPRLRIGDRVHLEDGRLIPD